MRPFCLRARTYFALNCPMRSPPADFSRQLRVAAAGGLMTYGASQPDAWR